MGKEPRNIGNREIMVQGTEEGEVVGSQMEGGRHKRLRSQEEGKLLRILLWPRTLWTSVACQQ